MDVLLSVILSDEKDLKLSPHSLENIAVGDENPMVMIRSQQQLQ
jgi:hypothetical protein